MFYETGMLSRTLFALMAVCLGACGAAENSSTPKGVEPDWRTFRSVALEQDQVDQQPNYRATPRSFRFQDLKNEGDAALAKRLLGAVGERIVFIDRHKDRWQYYDGDSAPIESIDLYSRPESWGSAFGICRSEKYEIEFSDDGKIEMVSVTPRYGVEGPIFQKEDFDWDFFRDRMCEDVPSNHTPSYFPASDVLAAQDLAILLSKAVYLAGQAGELPFKLDCRTYEDRECSAGTRAYLGNLRLHDIDQTSEINCPYASGPEDDCYTVTVGEHQLGPFPKQITIRGSTYMNNWKVHSVSIREGLTIS